MGGPTFLEGERVELRPIEPDDADFLQATINDHRVRRSLGAYRPYSRADEVEWIEAIGDDGDVHLLITVGGDPVGVIGFEPVVEPWGVVKVGYFLAPDHWGHGYATDALRALCGYAFDERRVHKVVAQAYAPNDASVRVLEKAGFSREGVFRAETFVEGEHVDVYRYGLLADEFDAD